MRRSIQNNIIEESGFVKKEYVACIYKTKISLINYKQNQSNFNLYLNEP